MTQEKSFKENFPSLKKRNLTLRQTGDLVANEVGLIFPTNRAFTTTKTEYAVKKCFWCKHIQKEKREVEVYSIEVYHEYFIKKYCLDKQRVKNTLFQLEKKRKKDGWTAEDSVVSAEELLNELGLK